MWFMLIEVVRNILLLLGRWKLVLLVFSFVVGWLNECVLGWLWKVMVIILLELVVCGFCSMVMCVCFSVGFLGRFGLSGLVVCSGCTWFCVLWNLFSMFLFSSGCRLVSMGSMLLLGLWCRFII